MSLDVYLYGPEQTVSCMCSECDNEHTRTVRPSLYSRNITHNLGRMADEAGIYNACWRPDEHGMAKARDLIEPLRAGLRLLRAEPDRFKAFNSPNGWGMYEHFVPFVAAYLEACEMHPDADVRVSR